MKDRESGPVADEGPLRRPRVGHSSLPRWDLPVAMPVAHARGGRLRSSGSPPAWLRRLGRGMVDLNAAGS